MLARTVPRRLTDCRTISVCTFSLPRYQYLAYYLADLILFYATPLLTATVLYSLIARKLLCRTRPVAHRGSRRPTAEYETPKRDGTATTCTTADANDTSSNVQVDLRAVTRPSADILRGRPSSCKLHCATVTLALTLTFDLLS